MKLHLDEAPVARLQGVTRMTAARDKSGTAACDPCDLSVVVDTAEILEAVQALIARLSLPITLMHFDRLEDALADSPDRLVLLPLRMPLEHLCHALQAGEALKPTLDNWRRDWEALHKVYRKARRRIIVMDAASLMVRPADCAEAIGARLGMPFEQTPVLEPAAAPVFSAMHMALAGGMLATDIRAQELADELGAMITGPARFGDLAQEDFTAAARELAEISEERDLLSETLRQTREMLEGADAQANEFARKSASLESALEKETRARSTLAEERDLLRENLRQMRETAEKAEAHAIGLQERNAELEKQLGAATEMRTQTQEALDQRETLLKAAQAESKEYADRVATLESALEKETRARSTLAEERDLLRENLRQMRETAEKAEAHAIGLQERNAELEKQLGAATEMRTQTQEALDQRETLLKAPQAESKEYADRVATLESALEKETRARSTLVEERDLLRESLRQTYGEMEKSLAGVSGVDPAPPPENNSDRKPGEYAKTIAALKDQLAAAHAQAQKALKDQLDTSCRQLKAAEQTHRFREAVLSHEVLQLAARARSDRLRSRGQVSGAR